MMEKENKQITLSDIQILTGKELIPENSFYKNLPKICKKIMQEEDYKEMYSNTGRPSKSPLFMNMPKVLLLMHYDNVSSRKAEEKTLFDLRWKVALNLGLEEAGFDHTTITRHIKRLLLNKKEKLFFDQLRRMKIKNQI